MLKHPGKLTIMQRCQSPQSPGVWGVNQSQGRTPQQGEVGGDQKRGRTPQQGELRGDRERGEKSPQQSLTKITKESMERLRQLQLLQLRLTNKNQDSKNSTQYGFTLIECLLAIMIVAILLSAVAPAIVLSVATRLQARRVELASQAAQTYIDGVRAGKIPAYLINPVPLNEVTVVNGKNTFDPKRADFAATLAPASSELDAANCLTTNRLYPYCDSPTSTLYCVDLDGNGCSNTSPRDLIVQSFRSRSTSQETAETAALGDPNELNRIINKNGYLLGVRVYRADSFKNGIILSGGKGQKDAAFTGGTGLKTNKEQPPLVEVTTEISARSSSSESKDTTSYKDMCERLGGCETTPQTGQ